MERLVAALLSIVRCHAGQQITRNKSVEIGDLIREISNPYQVEAQTRNVAFGLALAETAAVESDSSLLAVVFNNLFANAVNHTPEGGEIQAELTTNSDDFQFSITNANGQLESGDLAFLFDPFWQKDPSRSGKNGHGLGLSVVKSYADLLGLRVQVFLEDPRLVTFQVRIPRQLVSPGPFPTRDRISAKPGERTRGLIE